MGKEQNKYHVTDNGDIFKVNEDGSFTAIGNVSQISAINAARPSAKTKGWLMSNYNWLYLISLAMFVVLGLFGIFCYSYSPMLGMISLCAGVTAITLPWIFKSISKVWFVLLFLLLVAAIITIIVLSYEWLYTTQIALGFASLFALGIACAKKHKLSK